MTEANTDHKSGLMEAEIRSKIEATINAESGWPRPKPDLISNLKSGWSKPNLDLKFQLGPMQLEKEKPNNIWYQGYPSKEVVNWDWDTVMTDITLEYIVQ